MAMIDLTIPEGKEPLHRVVNENTHKGLDLIQRQQPELIDGYPTGNVYIGLTFEELAELEKELKALEIIKEKGLSTNDITFIKSGDSWETYAETMKELCWGDEHLDKVLKTKEEYDLLKEALL